jgi:type I restriction enzyme S subunit
MMEDWKKDKLSDLLELVYGKSLPKTKRADGNIPVYGSNGIVGFHDEAIVNEPGIIVGRKGSAGNIHFSEVPFCPIDTTFYITRQYTKLELGFLYYALDFLNLKRILGDVGVPGLNRDMAYLEELFYPSDKAEQRKIAHVLSTVQKAIEQQDNLIRTTTELKKALMQKLFTEGTRGEHQKPTEIGFVPKSWEVAKLGKTVEIKTGKLNSNAAVQNGIYPFFTCSQETFAINNYAFDQEAILLSGNNARAIYSVKHYKGKFNAYQQYLRKNVKKLIQ